MISPTAEFLIIPGSPALIEELAPADPASRRLAAAIRRLCNAVRGQVDIVCSRDERWYTSHAGSFRAWGAPEVSVGEGHYLGELVARYFLHDATIHSVRDQILPLNAERTTVVVLDGPAGLSERAPLALLPEARTQHVQCEELLNGHCEVSNDTQAMVEAGIIEPDLWQQAARLDVLEATLVDSDDSLGVGRYVATWKVAL